jgi:hypothetical protein
MAANTSLRGRYEVESGHVPPYEIHPSIEEEGQRFHIQFPGFVRIHDQRERKRIRRPISPDDK